MQPHVGQLELYTVVTVVFTPGVEAIDFVMCALPAPLIKAAISHREFSRLSGRHPPPKTYHQPTNPKEKI
jgi:hypothetical protein